MRISDEVAFSAERAPDVTAPRFEDRTWTYRRRLHEDVCRLAQLLGELAGPGDRVAVRIGYGSAPMPVATATGGDEALLERLVPDLLGVLAPSLGEEAVAVVYLRAPATAEDLRRHVGERLASFKVPAHVVFRDEPLPRTPSGKVLKRDLRGPVAAEVRATETRATETRATG